jgi:hypothetical protein
MESDMETLRSVGDSIVVSLEVSVEQLIRVNTLVLQRLKHLIRAEVGKGGVVDLDVAHTLIIQGLELLTVGLGQIGEEVLIIGVSLRAVALARGESQMKIAGWRHGKLALSPLLTGDTLAEHLPVIEVRALLVLDLGLAQGGHRVLLASLLKSSDRRRRETDKIPRHGLYLTETAETLKEAREVVLAIEFSGRDGADSMLLLLLDNIGNSSLLRRGELLGRDLASISLLLSAG